MVIYTRTEALDVGVEGQTQMWLVGKLHPMLVHFPIGLVLAAAAAELIAIHTGRRAWRTISVANVRAGAAMGAITVVAGWALASAPFVEPTRLLTWHRWTGVAAAAGAIGAALVSTWSGVPSRRSMFVYRTARDRGPSGRDARLGGRLLPPVKGGAVHGRRQSGQNDKQEGRH